MTNTASCKGAGPTTKRIRPPLTKKAEVGLAEPDAIKPRNVASVSTNSCTCVVDLRTASTADGGGETFLARIP